MKPEDMKNEGDVKKAVKALLKGIGAYYFMQVPTGYGKAGVLDFNCCVAGRFIAIETKFAGRKTTAHQDQNIDEIVAAGGIAVVVNQWGLESLEVMLEVFAFAAPGEVQPGRYDFRGGHM